VKFLFPLFLRHYGLDLHAAKRVGDAFEGVVIVVVVSNYEYVAT
jgi:hypothetical protein